MTDRELLEFAAKAAGIVVVRSRLHDPLNKNMLVNSSPRNPFQDSGAWNPLTDDGDAFRLAVKLRLSTGYAGVPTIHSVWAGNGVVDAVEPFEDAQSLRRAIVRAAAEIGKAMP